MFSTFLQKLCEVHQRSVQLHVASSLFTLKYDQARLKAKL